MPATIGERTSMRNTSGLSATAMASRCRPPPKSTLWRGNCVNPVSVRRYCMNTELPISVCGELNLEATDIPFPLAFRDCYFERPITLQLVRVPSLRFPGSHVPSMNGDQIAVLGNVELTQGFASEGEVRFSGAQVGGLLSCRGGSFTNPGGSALSAGRANITRGLLLDQGF